MTTETRSTPAAEAAAAKTTTKSGNITAIASGKGGVGKTWLSITLAHALARAEAKTLTAIWAWLTWISNWA